MVFFITITYHVKIQVQCFLMVFVGFKMLLFAKLICIVLLYCFIASLI